MDLREKLKVRKIKKTDKSAVLKLINSVNSKDLLEYSITDEWFDYSVENTAALIFAAFHGDDLVALSACMADYKSMIGDINIIVHPEYRKKGAGSLLYSETTAIASSMGLKALEGYTQKRLKDSVSFALNKGFSQTSLSLEMEIELEGNNLPIANLPDMNFIKAEPLDWQAYTRIVNNAFGYSADQNYFNMLFQDPSIEIFFICKREEAIGTATIQLKEDISAGYLYDMAILQEFRHKGIGSLLIANCLSRLKALKIKKASLVVDGQNYDAIRLYKKFGLQEKDTGMHFRKIL